MSNLPPNPKQFYGDKKPNLALVPPALEINAALAFKDGAIKYGPYNWRERAVEAMTYVAAIRRHLDRWVDGEDLSEPDPWRDPETGQEYMLGEKPELAHVAACVAILLDAMAKGNLIDNRPPAGGAAALIERWSPKQGGIAKAEANMAAIPACPDIDDGASDAHMVYPEEVPTRHPVKIGTAFSNGRAYDVLGDEKWPNRNVVECAEPKALVPVAD